MPFARPSVGSAYDGGLVGITHREGHRAFVQHPAMQCIAPQARRMKRVGIGQRARRAAPAAFRIRPASCAPGSHPSRHGIHGPGNRSHRHKRPKAAIRGTAQRCSASRRLHTPGSCHPGSTGPSVRSSNRSVDPRDSREFQSAKSNSLNSLLPRSTKPSSIWATLCFTMFPVQSILHP